MSKRISLGEAVEFHGHLGPWLVLGVLAGEYALKKLKAKKYFGISVKIWGLDKKPKSCFIDGLQLSTGATYGKGNIQKFTSPKIRIVFYNRANNKKFNISLKEDLLRELDNLRGHDDSELFAKKLYRKGISNLITADLKLVTDN